MNRLGSPAWMLAAFVAGILFIYSFGDGGDYVKPAIGQQGGIMVLLDKVEALTQRVTELEAQIAELGDAETKLAAISDDGATFTITGRNVQILSGSGATDDGCANLTICDSLTGLGNLIIGYNETNLLDVIRTGSHNLVIGIGHEYTGVGGLVGGINNAISNRYTAAIGGTGNTVSGYGASVSGGSNNTASGNLSSVSGGAYNAAIGGLSSVSGGYSNNANGAESSISGGYSNTTDAFRASVGGGSSNTASGENASVSGGSSNTASGENASVSGGANNTASGESASVSGGYNNTAINAKASVSGGWNCFESRSNGWSVGYTSNGCQPTLANN